MGAKKKKKKNRLQSDLWVCKHNPESFCMVWLFAYAYLLTC
jgi:hypothetical protein